MKNVLRLVEQVHQESLVNFAVLKSLLYKITNKENINLVKEFLEKDFEKEVEFSSECCSSTDAKTFLKNLIKDKQQ